MKIPASAFHTIGVGANSGSGQLYAASFWAAKLFGECSGNREWRELLAGGAMAPDTIASVFGVNLASATVGICRSAGAGSLGGVGVEVSSVAAQLTVSPSQINYLIPAATAVGARASS
ncbi:MAG: hypothetical protein U0Y68_07625 [Blastocatellia bacterium]